MDTSRMRSDYLHKDGRYTIYDYRDKAVFFSFLPGIAGLHGIPMWAFYTNRGQGICSFGVENKQRPIMQFFPAHQAAARVALQGFRTFLLVDGEYYEPFSVMCDDRVEMTIHSNMLEILSTNVHNGINVHVTYFTAASTPFPALIRRVKITSNKAYQSTIAFADGTPQIIPCGISNAQFKEEGNTFRAWMLTEYASGGTALYGIRQSLIDNTQISNPIDRFFCTSFIDDKPCRVTTDPKIVFGTDDSFQHPFKFANKGADVLQDTQYLIDRVPCAFAIGEKKLESGQCIYIDSVFGYANDSNSVSDIYNGLADRFDEMQHQAKKVTAELLSNVTAKTAWPSLDHYVGQSYLDNVLRGGVPYLYESKNEHLVHYVYGRRHGDLERDYNDFELQPTYYSQGNASYRDLCQNRRSDVFFEPEAGLFNIKLFVELLQIDGYNPLVIEGCSYRVEEKDVQTALASVKHTQTLCEIKRVITNAFTPGELLHILQDRQDTLTVPAQTVLEHCMYYAQQEVLAHHKNGYWSDHFSYNMDLIQSYLAVYPDKLTELLYEIPFHFFNSDVYVKPRSEQLIKTPLGIRQYSATARKTTEAKSTYLRTNEGRIVSVSLYTKLLCLALNKFCCLDPSGIGIEMEAGKPGWNDSLNGLPGLLGSGLPETIELIRLIQFLITTLNRSISMPLEVQELLCDTNVAAQSADNPIELWYKLATIKEEYRKRTQDTLCVKYVQVEAQAVDRTLRQMLSVLEKGLQTAQMSFGSLLPTYLYHEITDYETKDGLIQPTGFCVHTLPVFLESPARLMRHLRDKEALELHKKVKQSSLWDEKLLMYKVCDSLGDCPDELGRAKAFPRGWFENESIFLHMSYKYLLGLLEAGLYSTFYEEIHTSLVPFFSPEKYGRSILENCSFIASSVAPDPEIHGRGYIARLSGASAEVLSMWYIMMTGGAPFKMRDNELYFCLEPKLQAWLFDKDDSVTFTMLGRTKFVINNAQRLDTYETGIGVERYVVEWRDGDVNEYGSIWGECARRLRNKEAKKVIAYMAKV